MEIDINEVITDVDSLWKRCVIRNGYSFTNIGYPFNVFDAILIKYPKNVRCHSALLVGSDYALDEQVDFINQNKLEKALIIANDIDFIVKCPTLKYLEIIPSYDSTENFDYSPLYEMPNLKSLKCHTIYGKKYDLFTTIDYSKMQSRIEDIAIQERGHKNFNQIETLRSMYITKYDDVDLKKLVPSTALDSLLMITSKIKSLSGIQNSSMQCLYLYYNRSLSDISALMEVKNTLKALRIENCPNVRDFSVLSDLENLEFLSLQGSNSLENLDFLKKLKRLKTFVFNVNVEDGDLSYLINIPNVRFKNRRHFNMKTEEFSISQPLIFGNENIEFWRRLDAEWLL